MKAAKTLLVIIVSLFCIVVLLIGFFVFVFSEGNPVSFVAIIPVVFMITSTVLFLKKITSIPMIFLNIILIPLFFYIVWWGLTPVMSIIMGVSFVLFNILTIHILKHRLRDRSIDREKYMPVSFNKKTNQIFGAGVLLFLIFNVIQFMRYYKTFSGMTGYITYALIVTLSILFTILFVKKITVVPAILLSIFVILMCIVSLIDISSVIELLLVFLSSIILPIGIERHFKYRKYNTSVE